MTDFPVNYVRHHRERHGFSHAELARLSGHDSPSAIGHYEMGDRVPPLKAAFALALVLGVPLQKLFEQFYLHVEEGVVARAHELYTELEGQLDPISVAKRAALEAIPGRAVGNPDGV